MIIQCEQCDTRFRMADEKLKPGGTKVRCSKCKHVFTVMPPAPEPEPEPEAEAAPATVAPHPPAVDPAEESVDFGAFNMEQVGDTETAPEAASAATDNDLDFSGLESEAIASGAADGELADEFSFVDSSTAASEPSAEVGDDDPQAQTAGLVPSDEPAPAMEMDFGAAFEEEPEATPAGAEAPVAEFSFDEEPSAAPAGQSTTGEFEFGVEDPSSAPAESAAGEFSFDEETPAAAIATGEETDTFAFGDDADTDAFSFDDETDKTPPASADGFDFGDDSSAFSFGEESNSESSTAEWSEDAAADSGAFDFEEPQFETEAAPAKPAQPAANLQFGEIDFTQDETDTPSFESVPVDDFAGATLAREEEPAEEPSPPPPQHSREEPSRAARDERPLVAPPIKRKSPVATILRLVSILLLLLLLALGGTVGYFYYIDGGLDLNRIAQRFPILQDYLGARPASAPEQLIALNIAGSTYVNNAKAGQLLVIQGVAINNFGKARSAITVKGVLLDAQGKVLYQQTVFCGNPLKEEALSKMSFDRIEEAMNNQFGDSLSNMNVSAGAKIPFTIVFRNLPDGIANINVEVVDSKPGTS